MTTADVLLFVSINILLFAMLFTLQKISELKIKKIISGKQALLYTFITFVLPLLILILVVIIAKKDGHKIMPNVKS